MSQPTATSLESGAFGTVWASRLFHGKGSMVGFVQDVNGLDKANFGRLLYQFIYLFFFKKKLIFSINYINSFI